MKTRLLFTAAIVAATSLASQPAWCDPTLQTTTLSTPYTSESPWVGEILSTEGSYYLYNIGLKQFLGCGNSWGTQASGNEIGIPVTFELANGKYTIKTDAYYSGKHVGLNGYVDNGDSNQYWEFTNIGDENNPVYTIKGNNQYFANTERNVPKTKN